MLPFSQELLHYDTIYLFKGGFLLAVQLHGLYCSVTCHCLCLLFMTWLLGGLPNHNHPTWSLLFTTEKATSTGRLPLLLLSLECKIQYNSPYFCTNCSVAHFFQCHRFGLLKKIPAEIGLPLAMVTMFLAYAIWQKWFVVSLFFSLLVSIVGHLKLPLKRSLPASVLRADGFYNIKGLVLILWTRLTPWTQCGRPPWASSRGPSDF